MTTRVIHHGGIRIATAEAGAGNPETIVLSMGATASMEWWPPRFVDALVAAGCRVIRYDLRDTGGSTTNPPGASGYSVADLCDDLIAVLDAYGLNSAHLAGMSLGGLISQMAAVRHPERVRSLTLIASEPLNGGEEDGAGIDPRFMEHFGTMGSVDWTDRDAVTAFMLTTARLSAGSAHPFDEDRERERIGRELDRTSSIKSAFNHALIAGELDARWDVRNIGAPTLVIHGSEDPILPLASGQGIARQIPGAELLVLEGTGHELHDADLPRIAAAISRFLSSVPTSGSAG
ncbi:alpha/beta fold hydrolase [Longimicrobium terrae]|uniref:Pimeloyl-ACP methyl ester carboxylesterase n=1 Tax=Longimicrobium terrae TaxID=1639882 RepID=A0A841GX19_9BACT|nr:pimeloyl-ACP methyl ester carboxylesterase [Longimicrobium terrae]MBB6070095.1 pimeloyl-ACP methyl ester carboxylesterase [Longimicrobium terrae]NNC32998.1 alpha/beta hydrolase [Longimicrobium terrae]